MQSNKIWGQCVLLSFKNHLLLHLFFGQNSFSAPHHFNSEAFLEGRGLIIEGLVAIKANIREENFQAARETLGRVLHTLQVVGVERISCV